VIDSGDSGDTEQKNKNIGFDLSNLASKVRAMDKSSPAFKVGN
jgi:hypothetical protein